MEMILCPYPKSRKDIPANGIRIICEPLPPVSAPMLRRISRNTAKKKELPAPPRSSGLLKLLWRSGTRNLKNVKNRANNKSIQAYLPDKSKVVEVIINEKYLR